MATLSEYKALRQAAGARYAAAAGELHEAFVQLMALDLTIANRNVGGEVLKTFTGEIHDLPTGLRHPIYYNPASSNWNDEVKGKQEAYLRRFTST